MTQTIPFAKLESMLERIVGKMPAISVKDIKVGAEVDSVFNPVMPIFGQDAESRILDDCKRTDFQYLANHNMGLNYIKKKVISIGKMSHGLGYQNRSDFKTLMESLELDILDHNKKPIDQLMALFFDTPFKSQNIAIVSDLRIYEDGSLLHDSCFEKKLLEFEKAYKGEVIRDFKKFEADLKLILTYASKPKAS